MNRKWHALRPENPHGVPKAVMKALASEGLPNNLAAYDLRLQQLLTLHQLSKEKAKW